MLKIADPPMEAIERATHRKNLRVLISVRGVAFCAQIALILIAEYGFNIVLPIGWMFAVAGILVAFNLYSLYRAQSARPVGVGDLFLGLLVDVGVLSAQLAFSGGTANPFVSVYMLPVIIGAVMLTQGLAWAIYGLTLVGYLTLAVLSFNQPMPAMPGMASMNGLVDRFNLHMHGMMLGYALSAGLLVFLIMRIRANLQARDDELTAIKTRALQEEHIVRTGLLAAGAAHELGTPLTTLSIILKDLHDLPLPRRKADFAEDVATMQSQVDRCKAIVSDILTATGQTRGEGGKPRALKAFLIELGEVWQAKHAFVDLRLSIATGETPVLADRIIEQAVCNLLDNAREASETNGSRLVSCTATQTETDVVIEVIDEGPGFDEAVAERIGLPANSTKVAAARHRGHGLYLVAGTLRVLGGGLEWENRPQGGARVCMTIPLAAIRVA
jgi:two-component system sensor histidine kinase RegB